MNLPNTVPNQLPEFVRAEYPAFVEFVQAYYKWLTENYILSVEDVVDVDNTVDQYIKHFKRQLDVYGVVSRDDDRVLLKNIRQLYAAKGSEAGIDFFFKAFFGSSTGSTQYPWDYVFKPSSGVWKQDCSVFMQVSQGNPEELAGNQITLTNGVGAVYKTFVNQVSKRSDNVYELFIDRITVSSTTPLNISSIDGLIRGETLLSTVKVDIIDGGSGFEVGQIFRVDTTSGRGSFIKVVAVDSAGAMTAARLIGFGTGYTTKFNLAIFSRNLVNLRDSSISLVGTENEIPFSLLYPSNDSQVSSDQGIAIEHNYTDYNQGYMEADYVGRIAAVFENNKEVPRIGFDSALLQFSVGNICFYPGYYESNVNLISDATFIQDSYYHQAFSYVTSVDQTLKSYSSLLKSVLHPVGTRHFGNYQINDSFRFTPTARPDINVISVADIIRLFTIVSDNTLLTVNYIRDFANITRSTAAAPIMTVGKSLAHTTRSTSAFDRIVNYDRRPEDGFSHISLSTSTFSRVVNYDRRPADGFNHLTQLLSDFSRTAEYNRAIQHTALAVSGFNRTAQYDRRPEDGFSDGSVAISGFNRTVDYDRRPSHTTVLSSSFSRTVDFRPALSTTAVVSSVLSRDVEFQSSLATTARANSTFSQYVDYKRGNAGGTDPEFNHTTISSELFTYLKGIFADFAHTTVSTESSFSTLTDFKPSLSSIALVSSEFSRTAEYAPSLATTALAVSALSRTVATDRQLIDGTTINDINLSNNMTTPYTSGTTLSELLSLNMAKYLTHAASTTESGYIILNPYVEALPESYWDAGYVENESII